ncbi:DNA-processing protein DprA [Shimia biformata]|uniref:DNA-processing protein DprA n=1 Tax=Shimia biformata TaxID=1294299 RepID=UPI00194FEE34|nr:DNA-processing protein DprA [Shimia biformata]
MPEDQFSSTHPQLPPTTEEDRFSWLRLLRSRRVGISTFNRLLAEHGSAADALRALPDIARAAGVDDYATQDPAATEAELRAGEKIGARLIYRGDADYPALFHDLTDAPPMFWALGNTDLLKQPTVAMAGARNASSLGTRMARQLARDLGEAGFVTVSGFARGIDTACHAGSAETGTIAVFAGGVDRIYPAENATLAKTLAETGLRISEQPIGLVPQARHFPPRNRLISGLAPALVIVEAAARSGSLITARNALDQGRDVLAVPGHPFDARAAGCNMLIRDGATLVRGADDVIEAIGHHITADAAIPDNPQPGLHLVPPHAPAENTRDLRTTHELHMQILQQLGPSPVGEDQLIRDLGAPASIVSPALVDLEVEGRVRRQAGGLLSRA